MALGVIKPDFANGAQVSQAAAHGSLAETANPAVLDSG